MIRVDVKTKGKGLETKGEGRFAFKTAKELEEFVIGNHILFAKDILRQFQEKDLFPEDEKQFLTRVDSRIGAKEERVKAFGKIEYIPKLTSIVPVIKEAIRLVQDRSPRGRGYYARHNVLVYNGRIVAKGISDINVWLNQDRRYKNTDRFRILNIAPYSRKLERRGTKRGTAGKSKGITDTKTRKGKNRKGQDITLPNGAYILANRLLRNRFPAFKDNIKFSFIPVNPSTAKVWNSSAKSITNANGPAYTFKKNRQNGRAAGRPYLYASISITINPQAINLNSGFTESGDKL